MKYGIMQGRLTPSQGRGIQFFPFDNWQQEFYDGKEIGLNEIEWIFDYSSYEENPLWSYQGIEQIKKTIDKTSVTVKSVCFDYFMRRPFYKNQDFETLRENIEIAKQVIENMSKIGASLLEIPMVDESSIKTSEEAKKALIYARELLEYASDYRIKISLETDLPPGNFRDFLDRVEGLYANYDSGNSSGLGYNHEMELISLRELVANVHIKDRILGGTTVELGTGNADFDLVFSALKEINYKGSIILQAARSEDGTEVDNIKSQLNFIKRYVEKYGLG